MTQPRVEQIPALTGVRILAAAWVVVEHFRNVIYGLFPSSTASRVFIEGGYLGVEVFFILSGFIISHNYADRFSSFHHRTYINFLRNRIARLYPVHAVTLAIVTVLVVAASLLHVTLASDGKYDPVGFVMNLLMLQAIPPAQAWNGPAWSIGTEAGAYIAFPLVALALARLRSLLGITFMLLVALSITVGGEFWLSAAQGFDPTGYASMWLRIAGEFAAGCFTWSLWRRVARGGAKHDWLAVIGVVGIILVLAMSNATSDWNFLVLPFVALFVFGCATAAGPVRRILSARAMVYGGRISYSLYMTHFIVLMIGGKVLPWTHFEHAAVPVRIGVLGAYFVAAFAAAVIVYHFVEEPGRRIISRRGSRSPKVIERDEART